MVPTGDEGTMGLDMKTRKSICGRIFKRYQKAAKKDKAKILDEYAQLLGYNRDYLANLLTNWGKTRYAVSDGTPVKYIAKSAVKSQKKTCKGKKTGRPEKYDPAFVKVLSFVWDFFDFPCGKLLAPLLKGIIDYMVSQFGFDKKTHTLLCSISPATIDRKLRNLKKRHRLKGIHTTKPGTLLKSQIPIRVCFDRNERRPGYFELDTVSHCGALA